MARTQGDKKLINPAKKAINNVVFIKIKCRLVINSLTCLS